MERDHKEDLFVDMRSLFKVTSKEKDWRARTVIT